MAGPGRRLSSLVEEDQLAKNLEFFQHEKVRSVCLSEGRPTGGGGKEVITPPPKFWIFNFYPLQIKKASMK